MGASVSSIEMGKYQDELRCLTIRFFTFGLDVI